VYLVVFNDEFARKIPRETYMQLMHAYNASEILDEWVRTNTPKLAIPLESLTIIEQPTGDVVYQTTYDPVIGW
jgi:hypothetical protein